MYGTLLQNIFNLIVSLYSPRGFGTEGHFCRIYVIFAGNMGIFCGIYGALLRNICTLMVLLHPARGLRSAGHGTFAEYIRLFGATYGALCRNIWGSLAEYVGVLCGIHRALLGNTQGSFAEHIYLDGLVAFGARFEHSGAWHFAPDKVGDGLDISQKSALHLFSLQHLVGR